MTQSANRGGARNRVDRESYSLTRAQVAKLIAAEHHAANIGLPFTRMVTIHWEAAGIPLDGMVKATRHFLDLLTKTVARHGNRTAWLWVHENGDGRDGQGKGGHCHLLLHLPAELVQSITRRLRGWLRRITGQPYKRGVIRSKPIGGRLGLEVTNPDLHAANLRTVLHHLLQQTSMDVVEQFNLRWHQLGGRIVGKRCGTSQNIGPKAQGEEG